MMLHDGGSATVVHPRIERGHVRVFAAGGGGLDATCSAAARCGGAEAASGRWRWRWRLGAPSMPPSCWASAALSRALMPLHIPGALLALLVWNVLRFFSMPG